ncbi:MAG: S-methyl-5-thioribose-1-phosphate isomerase [Cytophagales bacterium]|nr:S-methyl-5-thioribose-1-phosphate isomerase [Cytophagales bacterium]
MLVNGKPYRTIRIKPDDPKIIQIIDQRKLPFEFVIENLSTVNDAARAIKEMYVRGAPLIGVTAAYGMYLAALQVSKPDDNFMQKAAGKLKATRPTAVNLLWAVEKQLKAISQGKTILEMRDIALKTANQLAEADVQTCKKIGEYGLSLIEKIYQNKKEQPVNILTHCNAGWLACVDYGTATAPMFLAHDKGIPIHIWVDETRPRNQGSKLTAWELAQYGIPHTVIVDSAGGHLMQRGLVDMVLVGTDRTTYTGDVANKIGTYPKALAAKDNSIPFYVALPSSSIDWNIRDGLKEIPIEQRDADEVHYVDGWCEGVGRISGSSSNSSSKKVRITPKRSPAANYGFDVTPARLVTALITERGICLPNEESISGLFPENQEMRVEHGA